MNFDSLLSKVLALSNSILLEQDHLIVGRKGAGKESIIRLSAFFNSLYLRIVPDSIRGAAIELL